MSYIIHSTHVPNCNFLKCNSCFILFSLWLSLFTRVQCLHFKLLRRELHQFILCGIGCCIAAALLLFYDIHHQLSCTAFPKRECWTSLIPFHSRLHTPCFGGPDKTSDNKASLSRHQHKNTLLLYLNTIVAFDMTTMYHHCYTLNISKRLSYICFGRLLPSFCCYE